MVEAVRWYRKAAEQGEAAAQFNLGNAYCYGNGVPRDVVEGNKWHELGKQSQAAALILLENDGQDQDETPF